MILKPGVKIANLKPQLLIAIIIADNVYSAHKQELVITSVDDSKHGSTTLHGSGNAFDCRTSYFTKAEQMTVHSEIKNKCGDNFDVILELDHIHIEHDPR
jgi:phospholipase C